ncbi:unnamed protein product [Angiostrongylus costaricensis]|uniref:Phytase-like domain-containing protein n=1 Tax=Angiostrongylus costaricensis TaxID=334426 RepID=A0A158PCX3_ANGCS|nr:unnamed protein product [Angiostrongylus costaricensis]
MTSVPSLLALLAITYAAPGPPIQDDGLQFYNIQGGEELPIDDDVPLEYEEGEQGEAFILPTSKILGEISGLTMDLKGRLVAFHRANREWNQNSFDGKGVFNKKLGPIKNFTIAVIDTSNGKAIHERRRKKSSGESIENSEAMIHPLDWKSGN